jgi:hypothetical protein
MKSIRYMWYVLWRFGIVALFFGLIYLAPPWTPAPKLPTHIGPPRCYDALLTNGHTSWLGVACNTPLGVQIITGRGR